MWIYSLYTMVDGIFVSHGVGEAAFAAVNLAMPYVWLVFASGILLASLAARYKIAEALVRPYMTVAKTVPVASLLWKVPKARL